MSREARRGHFHEPMFTTLLTEKTRRTRETHAGLWFDKYLLKQEEKKRQESDQKESTLKDDIQYRHILVKEVCALPEPAMYEAFFRRWEALLHEEHNAKGPSANKMIMRVGA